MSSQLVSLQCNGHGHEPQLILLGECALLPSDDAPSIGPPNKPHGHGSLWLEEREGRIKVLDIQVSICCRFHDTTIFS